MAGRFGSSLGAWTGWSRASSVSRTREEAPAGGIVPGGRGPHPRMRRSSWDSGGFVGVVGRVAVGHLSSRWDAPQIPSAHHC